MNALAIDCASSSMLVSAKKGNEKASLLLDFGARQSQEILPAIDYVVSKLNLNLNELDYTAVCKGPGTFTGLRVSFSAAKALSLSHDIPVYGISTLKAYAEPYKSFDGIVIPTVDAKKEQYFFAAYKNGIEILPPGDSTTHDISEFLKSLKQTGENSILCVGKDCEILAEFLKASEDLKITSISTVNTNSALPESLFSIAEKMIEEKIPPVKDFEGPEYLRKSEAELALENR